MKRNEYENQNLQPGPIVSLSNSSTDRIKKKPRRPPGLVLNKALLKPVTRDPEINPNETSTCGICNKSLPTNPQLCNRCQIWNDAHHVFECLREEKKWVEHPLVTVREVLARKECMICREIGEAVLLKFKTSDLTLQEELLEAKLQNYGPYCFGEDTLNKLGPEPLRKYGRHQMNPDDLRLAQSSKATEIEIVDRAVRTRVVVYLVLSAPPGSLLCNYFPELDSYRTPDTTAKSTADKFNPGVHRIALEDEAGLLQPTIGLQIELHYANGKTGLLGLNLWDNIYIETSLLSRWLQECNTHHQTLGITSKTCKLGADQPPLPTGFKAIDTYQLCVVDLHSSPLPNYAALSYTWGATAGIKELQLERCNQENLHTEGALRNCTGIPDVISDAITLCASMGQQYLWVDRLCIVQDDLESKMRQINAMDRIYHMASFTIVAAVPLGVGLPGVQGRPRKPNLSNYSRRFHPKLRFIVDNFKLAVLGSFWNTRGWTYQERILSRRAIYITEWQAYFLCNRGAEQEEIGDIAASYNPWNLHRFGMYVVTVGDYTSKNLTFGSDILNAFAGIGNRFAAAMGKSLCYGLPERYFAQALLWELDEMYERRQEAPDIPSWAWAAWRGRIKYELNSRVDNLSIGTLVRFYFADPIRGLRQMGTDETWFWKEVNLGTFDSLPLIDPLYPEMRFMPDAEESEAAWRACLQNPWTLASHSLNELDLIKMSQQHPRALIFRTTSAMVTLERSASRNYIEIPSFVKLDITIRSSLIIGQFGQIPYSLLDKTLNLHVQHEIIVVAAGIATEPVRYTQTHSTLHVSGDIQQPKLTESPWYLHVMLIKRDGCGVARRIGTGAVEMRAWEDCRPKWCTIILA